jgi:hypothetical protein
MCLGFLDRFFFQDECAVSKPKSESDDKLRCYKRARGKRSDSKTTVEENIGF